MKKLKYMITFLIIFSSCEDTLFETVPPNDPIGNFESLWTTFNERYAVFEQRGVDWQQLYEQYRPMVNPTTSEEELYDILKAMLSHLNDGHVSLMADGKSFWNSHREFTEQKKIDLFQFQVVYDYYVDKPMTTIDNQYAYGKINGKIGYLYAAGLSGRQPTFIDDFMLEMQDMEGVIIDLRHNNGGDFTNGEVIASRFADQKRLAFTAMPKNGAGTNDFGERVDYFIEKAGNVTFNKPIVVLTNIYTISAGENLVLYLRVLPNVTLVGENTTGAMGERIEKEMPNGWVYSITGQVMFAADGISYEGSGIPPDIRVTNTLEALANGVDNMLDKALEIVAQ